MRALAPLCLALGVGSCGDPTGTGGRLQIVISDRAAEWPLPVIIGQSASEVVSVVRPDGFTGPVELTVSPVPADVTTASVTVGPDRTWGLLSFEAAPDATPSVTTLTVRARGDNVVAAEAELGLWVCVRGQLLPGDARQVCR